MKGKMAIVGDGDSVLAFSAVGIDAFPVINVEDAMQTIKNLAKEYAIIFVTDVIASEISEFLERYVTSAYPIILPVPSKSGSNGYGIEQIKKAMDKALGVDILFNNDKDE